MSYKTMGRAVVEVTIEMPTNGGGWGGDCTLDQVYKQATENVLATLNKHLSGIGARVVKSRVTQVLAAKED